MPAILDAAAAATATTTRNNGGGAPSILARSRRTRAALLALQATCLVLGVVTTALMGSVLYRARDVEAEDAGFVVHRASSALVVWDGVGGAVSGAVVGWVVYAAARADRAVLGVSLTGKESFPLYVFPTLTGLLLFALARSIIATAYSFADFNEANALALAWDGEFNTRPSFFTPETYAANQGWGDSTSPEVAARARAARILCAVLTVLTGLAVLLVLGLWRRERMEAARGRGGHERVGSVADGDEERKEMEGREVMELEHRQRAELAEGKDGGDVHEAGGKQVHEMEAGAGAHEMEERNVFEVEGTQAHEMPADEENGRVRMVYEMDAGEPGWRAAKEDGKWDRGV